MHLQDRGLKTEHPKPLTFGPGSDFHQWRVDQLLARGGWSSVYLGTDHKTGERVALKEIKAEPSLAKIIGDHESRALSLGFPNAPKLLFYGDSNDGRPVIVMTYHAGETLQALTPMPILRGLGIIQDTSRVLLQLLKEHGRIHADLKPANLLIPVDLNARPILLDLASTQRPGELPPQPLRCTPRYMAPECFRGEALTVATDIHSLGCTLYEILACNPAYTGMGNSEVRNQKLMAHIYTPSFRGFPRPIAELISDMLGLIPERRITSHEKLQDRFDQFFKDNSLQPKRPVLTSSETFAQTR